MKKLYTLSLLLLGMAASFAQTFFSENMGTPSGTTQIAANVFQNTTPVAYSGTADIRSSVPSTGYTGASGGGNVFFTNTVGKSFLIEGINTSEYSAANLQLSFGHLKTTLDASTELTVEVSTDGTGWTPLTYTRESGAGTANNYALVTIGGGQIPSAENLRIRFTQSATTSVQFRIDDVKLSNVSAACTLSLGDETAVCDAETLNTDTYTVTLPFTGGGNATYGVVASAGTIGGDNPSATASGNIIISNISEGVNVTIDITGGDCVLSREVVAVSCKPVNTLPFNENFDYEAGNSLTAQQKWAAANSGDNIVAVSGNLEYTGVASTGNSVSLSGAGIDAWTPFTPVTSGTVYASFLFSVTDATNVTADPAETVFAVMTGDDITKFNGRIFYKKVGEQYQIGLDTAGTTTNYTATSYNIGDTVFVILGFDFDTSTFKAWINPTISTFTAATPATLTKTVASLPMGYSQAGFLLRQDGATTTPTITVDELKIAITPAGALSVTSNDIAGLKVYPNPVSNGTLFVTSQQNAAKTIAIYDVVGKQVLNAAAVNDAVNVSGLTAGMYIVKITEEGRTATRKLVIK